MSGYNLQYEAIEDRFYAPDWRVESDPDEEGCVRVTLFSGPLAQERAEEYATWKNSADEEDN